MQPEPASPFAAARSTLDVGNIFVLEHANVCVPDQGLATVFYVIGLGLTRDPYMRLGPDGMGINVGRGQLHLGTTGTIVRGVARPTQVLRGTIGLVLPDLRDLVKRLEKVAKLLAGTKFSYQASADHVEVTCPWGNRYRCHAPQPEFGSAGLALAYIEFDVPRGSAAGIARFYEMGLRAPAQVETRRDHPAARVDVGVAQTMWFRETDDPIPPYDGHHIQIYIANYTQPYRFCEERKLVIEGSVTPLQFSFRDIVDLRTGEVLFAIEHEVRSLKHPSFNRPLVNRNPAQTNNNSAGLQDEFVGSTGNL
jgi:hypothetical protein